MPLHHRDGLASKYLRNQHDLTIYTPPGYSADRQYPVLYLQDGQNLFDPATAFGGQAWEVDKTADRLIEGGCIQPLIIVGVGNAGRFRIDEYTPSKDRQLGSGGKAWRYGRMLIEDVKPLIDAEYSTDPSPEATGLGGSSLGGLVSLYIGLHHACIFGKLAILSPSVWWSNRAIIETVLQLEIEQRPRIWLDIGTQEGSEPQKTLEDLRLLRYAFLKKGWKEGEELYYTEVDGAAHDEPAWRQRVAPMLQYLYPPKLRTS